MKNSPLQDHRKSKKKRGAQKGNQNARKHGFYASKLNPTEICEFWNILYRDGIDPEIAVFRIKLRSLLQYEPGNQRALAEASRSLSRWIRMKYGLGRSNTFLLKKLIMSILQQSLDPALVPLVKSLYIDGHQSVKQIERTLTIK
jgi:hypothetical protein